VTELNWLRAQEDAPFPSMGGGASGYFSEPADTLDPHLFDGDTLRSTVRNLLIGRLVGFFRRELNLQNTESWLYVYLAGSGITYQWMADRGNGDLDVLLGINRVSFNQANPDFEGLGDTELSEWLNTALRTTLWPTMSNTDISGKTYEVTYFYNPGTGTDITNINPYAAYSLNDDKWIVRPPAEVASHHTFPKRWQHEADDDAELAGRLVMNYRHAYNELASSAPHSATFLNAGSKLNTITAHARAVLDDIHHGRRAAFQGGGEGYLDWHNFRWQRAKQSGTIKGLSEISGVRQRAQELSDTELYGAPLPSTDDLLLRAMLYRKAQ
jgi:hypothetical protein